MYYVITRAGKLVGVTREDAYTFSLPDVVVHEFEEVIPDLNAVVWSEDLEALVADTKLLTKLLFLNRFTIGERLAIRSSSDPIVRDILNLLELADYVDVTDQNTMQGVGYLAMTGLIANERVAEILA